MSDEINGRCSQSAYGDGRLGASDLLAARLDERAMIAAWLRSCAVDRGCDGDERGARALVRASYAIERGEHHQ